MEFERLTQLLLKGAHQARATNTAYTDLQQAIQLYRGDLLPGLYAEWLLLERERWHAWLSGRSRRGATLKR